MGLGGDYCRQGVGFPHHLMGFEGLDQVVHDGSDWEEACCAPQTRWLIYLSGLAEAES